MPSSVPDSCTGLAETSASATSVTSPVLEVHAKRWELSGLAFFVLAFLAGLALLASSVLFALLVLESFALAVLALERLTFAFLGGGTGSEDEYKDEDEDEDVPVAGSTGLGLGRLPSRGV